MSNNISAKQSVALDIGVIGAGIAGLSAAIGLCRAGHRVEIFERSNFANEVGAAINVCPNASKVLSMWGFDFTRAQAVIVKEARFMDGNSLQVNYHGRYDDLFARFGAPYYFVHRVDLHNELKLLARTAGAEIRLGCEVQHMDCEHGTFTTKNGQVYQKDLIIAADGLHSIATSSVNGYDKAARATGQSAFRFMVPTKKWLDAGLGKSLFVDGDIGINLAITPGRRLVWYPCRDGELQNLVAIHPSKLSNNVEAWNVAASLEQLLDEYKNFNPEIVKVCSLAEDLKLWELLYRDPVQSWVKGLVGLSGDAAHPMLPHQGQGGGQAIEDAGALAVLFSNLPSKDIIRDRLLIYQDVRKDRAASIQVLSNAGQDEAAKVQAEARKYMKGRPVPSNQQEFQEYNFGYDVVAESYRLLEAQNGKL